MWASQDAVRAWTSNCASSTCTKQRCPILHSYKVWLNRTGRGRKTCIWKNMKRRLPFFSLGAYSNHRNRQPNTTNISFQGPKSNASRSACFSWYVLDILRSPAEARWHLTLILLQHERRFTAITGKRQSDKIAILRGKTIISCQCGFICFVVCLTDKIHYIHTQNQCRCTQNRCYRITIPYVPFQLSNGLVQSVACSWSYASVHRAPLFLDLSTSLVWMGLHWYSRPYSLHSRSLR